MIGDYVRSLEGIATLGVVGLVASFAIFLGIVVCAFRTSTGHCTAMANLPFDDDHAVTPHDDEGTP
jgi:hypothetical protein